MILLRGFLNVIGHLGHVKFCLNTNTLFVLHTLSSISLFWGIICLLYLTIGSFDAAHIFCLILVICAFSIDLIISLPFSLLVIIGEVLCRFLFITEDSDQLLKYIVLFFFLTLFFEILCFRATSRFEQTEIRDLLFVIPFYLVLVSFFNLGYKPTLKSKINEVAIIKQQNTLKKLKKTA